MMNKFYEKDPVWFAVACIIVYVGGFSTADSISAAIGMPKLITCLFGLFMSYVLYSFVKNNNLSDYYGLRKIKGTPKQYLYFIPLAVLSTVNLWHGLTFNLSFRDTVFYIISMCFVGFLEELIFRGILFSELMDASKDSVFFMSSAFIISCVSFGMGHIVNLFLGAPLADTLLQLVYATAIGFLYITIFVMSGSIIPCIVSHAFVNCTSVFAAEIDIKTHILITVIMCAICIIYGIKIMQQRINPMLEEYEEEEKKQKEEEKEREEHIKAIQEEIDMRKQNMKKIEDEIEMRKQNIEKIEDELRANEERIKKIEAIIREEEGDLRELKEIKEAIRKKKQEIEAGEVRIGEIEARMAARKRKYEEEKDDEFLREHCADIYDIFADRIKERDYQSICEEIIRESYHLPAESVRNLVKFLCTKDHTIHWLKPHKEDETVDSMIHISINDCGMEPMYEQDICEIINELGYNYSFKASYGVEATITWVHDPFDDYWYEVEVNGNRYSHIDGNRTPIKVSFEAENIYGSPFLATEWKIYRRIAGSPHGPDEFKCIIFIDVSEKAEFDDFNLIYLEECFDTVSEAFASDPKRVIEDSSVKSALKEITGYYGSKLWKYHYWLDERGFLPSDLKRGVLSQDGVYNLLTEIDEYKKENYHE